MSMGRTSIIMRCLRTFDGTFARTAPRIASPSATEVSGSTDVQRSGISGNKPRSRDRIAGTREVPPTRTTSLMSSEATWASDRTLRTRASLRSSRPSMQASKSALVTETRTVGVLPPRSLGAVHSTVVCCSVDSSSLAREQARRRPSQSPGDSARKPLRCSTTSSSAESMSSPPKALSPPVARVSKRPSDTRTTVTSVVPPPASKTKTSLVPETKSPYTTAAAVDSVMSDTWVNPAWCRACRVAVRWGSVKWAGTPTTALVTVFGTWCMRLKWWALWR
mmetsp:Transcript_21658/g.63051  ORF Transcript_21658/g.63051 Transcript_21658/m.63051 type:complete len:278 (+) Transcript_21658:577-1410(+)